VSPNLNAIAARLGCRDVGEEMTSIKSPCVGRSEDIPFINLWLCLKYSLSASQGRD